MKTLCLLAITVIAVQGLYDYDYDYIYKKGHSDEVDNKENEREDGQHGYSHFLVLSEAFKAIDNLVKENFQLKEGMEDLNNQIKILSERVLSNENISTVNEKKIKAKIENIEKEISLISSKNGLNDARILEIEADLSTTAENIGDKLDLLSNFTSHYDKAILISGGYPNFKSVEALRSDGTPLCAMKNLPDDRRWATMDGDLICGGGDAAATTSCLHYGVGGWSKYNWNLKEKKKHHLSWILPNGNGVQLLGGYYGGKTSEIVSSAGSSRDGFNLKYETSNACGIQHDDVFIITGGSYTMTTVSRYNMIGWVEDLPSLNHRGRMGHACGHYYSLSNELFYLVTGGWDGGNYLATTEIMSSGSGGWKSVGRLPSVRHSPRGITVANRIFVTGGWNGTHSIGDILQFDPISNEWMEIGQMNQSRNGHAVSVIPLDQANKMCI